MARYLWLLVFVALELSCKAKSTARRPVEDDETSAPRATASASAASVQPKDQKSPIVANKRDYDVRLGGKRLGEATIEHKLTPDGGVIEESRFLIEMKIKDDNPATRRSLSESTTEYGPDLKLRKSKRSDKENDVDERVEVTVTGSSLRVVVDKLAHKDDKTFTVPADWNSGLAVFQALRARAVAGEKLPLEGQFSEFDDKDLEFEPQSVKIVERTRFDSPTGKVDAWVVEFHDKKDGEVLKAVMDDAGLPWRFAIDPITADLKGTVAGSEEALEVDPTLPVDGKFDEAAPELRVDLTITGDASNEKPALIDSPYQKVTRAGDTYSLTLFAPRAKKSGVVPLPMTGLAPEVSRFLSPTPDSQSDDPAIVARSKEIVGGETDSKKAARAIATWVFQKLKKADGVRGRATAVETLGAMRGDCTEHAALVVALSRAAGIPARNAGGIVLLSTPKIAAGYHAWSEVWVGEWAVVDAALGRMDPGAAYIWLEYDEPGEINSIAMARMIGKTRISAK